MFLSFILSALEDCLIFVLSILPCILAFLASLDVASFLAFNLSILPLGVEVVDPARAPPI